MCVCGSKRILSVSGKCSDMCSASFGELEYDGYVPSIEAIGGGDYIDIEVCVECGRLQNFQPLTDRQIKAALNSDDADEDDDDDWEADDYDDPY